MSDTHLGRFHEGEINDKTARTWLSTTGFKGEWDPDDWETVRRHHKERYPQMKRERSTSQSPWDMEGFHVYLFYMLSVLGASFKDIAAELGVSHQRVSQWIAEGPFTLKDSFPEGSQPRVWNDDEHVFEGVSREEYGRRIRERERAKALAALEETREQRREKDVRVLKVLAGGLGRKPNLKELQEARGMTYQNMARHWGYGTDPDDPSFATASRRLYQAAGFDGPPGQGSPGHLPGCDCPPCRTRYRSVMQRAAAETTSNQGETDE